MKPAILLPLSLLLAAPAQAQQYGAEPDDLRSHLVRLAEAYPDVVDGFDEHELILAGGKRLPLSDGRTDKTFEELLNDPDIGDMFAFAYPAGAPAAPPPVDFDPGRIRVEALFKALYGDCGKAQVAKRMRRIDWVPGHGGRPVSVTTAQGVDKALERVSRDLDRLPRAFGKYLTPSAGTYNCRAIAGTSRQSMHSYAAAIDVNTDFSDYWQWAQQKSGGPIEWRNRMPMEIVEVFERHGFVWGGRWHHYDTMHFEYRPDLLGAE